MEESCVKYEPSSTFKCGSTFCSFQEFDMKFKYYKEQNGLDFIIDYSRTLEQAHKHCHERISRIPQNLKYYFVRYVCAHGSPHKKRKIDLEDAEVSTFQQDCPAFIYLHVSNDNKSLQIFQLSEEHNHAVEIKELPPQQNSRLQLHEDVIQLTELRLKRTVIQNIIQEKYNRKLSLEDISNIITSGKHTFTEILENIVKRLQEKYDCDVKISITGDVKLAGVFIQSDKMKEALKAFPEMIFINRADVPSDFDFSIVTIMVEDGNGHSEIVSAGLFTLEDEPTLRWFIKSFKDNNPDSQKTSVIMIDEHFVLRSILREFFPSASLFLNLFNTLETFNKIVTCKIMQIFSNEKDYCQQILEAICYSNSEASYNFKYKVLRRMASQNVLNYFDENWHAIKKEWVLGLTFASGNFLSKVNRLEKFNFKLGGILSSFSSLEDFVNKLFGILFCLKVSSRKLTLDLDKKIPVKPALDQSTVHTYAKFLTPYACKFIQNQLSLSFDMELAETDSGYTLSTEEKLVITPDNCNCSFFTFMRLPCRHIFAARQRQNLPAFDKSISHQRWYREHYCKTYKIPFKPPEETLNFPECNSPLAKNILSTEVSNLQLEIKMLSGTPGSKTVHRDSPSSSSSYKPTAIIFQAGLIFSSFQEFEIQFDKYKKENRINFHVSCCQTLSQAEELFPNKFENVSQDLKYHFIKYNCIHQGAFQKMKECVKESAAFYTNCEAFIFLHLNIESHHLQIAEIYEEHSHELLEHFHRPSLSLQSNLAQNTKSEIPKPSRINGEQFSGKTPPRKYNKVVLSKDKYSVVTFGKSWFTANLEGVIGKLKEKHECDIRLAMSANSKLLGLLIQSFTMQLSFKTLPEIIFVDNIFRLKAYNISFLPIAAEDSNGEKEIIAIGLFSLEDSPTLTWFFETFRMKNNLEKLKIIASGENGMLKRILKQLFPNFLHSSRFLYNFFFNDNNFTNKSCNKLEKFNSRVKNVSPTLKSLEEFVDELFNIFHCVTKETDKLILQTFQKTPVLNDNAENDSTESRYNCLLTPYAFKFVTKHLALSSSTKIVSKDFGYSIEEEDLLVKENCCSCSFSRLMQLPCKHTLALRKKLGISLYDKKLCNQKWHRDFYYNSKHRAYVQKNIHSVNSNKHCALESKQMPNTMPVVVVNLNASKTPYFQKPSTNSQNHPSPLVNSTRLSPLTNNTRLSPLTNNTRLSPLTNNTRLSPLANDTGLSPLANNTCLSPLVNSAHLSPSTSNHHSEENSFIGSSKLSRKKRSADENENSLLKIGLSFSSFQEFEQKFNEYKKLKKADFFIVQSRTLQQAENYCAKRVANIPPTLEYYFVKYLCIHGGTHLQKKALVGIQASLELGQDCPAFIFLHVSIDNKSLQIFNMCEKHNHELSAELESPNNSLISRGQELDQEVQQMSEGQTEETNEHEMQDASEDTIPVENDATPVEIALDIIPFEKFSSKGSLEKLVGNLQNKHSCDIVLSVTQDIDIIALYIQDDEMNRMFKAFPEIIFIDESFRNSDSLSVLTVSIEDSNGQSNVVAVGFFKLSDETKLEWFFDTFKKNNPTCEKTHTIMSDKDLIDENILKKAFPNYSTYLCIFHSLQALNKEIKDRNLTITSAEHTRFKQLFENLCRCTSENAYTLQYKELKNAVNRQMMEYFDSSWSPIRNKWTAGITFGAGSFLSRTNERLKLFDSQVKNVASTLTSLGNFVEELFTILNSVRKETDEISVHLIKEIPIVNCTDNRAENMYVELLTPYAFKFILKQLSLSFDVDLVSSGKEFSSSSEKCAIKEDNCDCSFFKVMRLPCKHIFAVKRKLNVPLFDNTLCHRRWWREHYFKNHRIFMQKNNKTPSTASTSTKGQSSEKRLSIATVATTKIAALVSESNDSLYRENINILKFIFKSWNKSEKITLTVDNGNNLEKNHS